MDVRRFHFTPAWLVYAALVAEAFLMLPAMLRWPPFNDHKGWPALTCTAIVVVAMLLIALGFVAARILRWRFRFSLRSLLMLVLVVAIACGWLASAMARARKQADLVAEASK